MKTFIYIFFVVALILGIFLPVSYLPVSLAIMLQEEFDRCYIPAFDFFYERHFRYIYQLIAPGVQGHFQLFPAFRVVFFPAVDRGPRNTRFFGGVRYEGHLVQYFDEYGPV